MRSKIHGHVRMMLLSMMKQSLSPLSPENLCSEFLTRSDPNQPMQPQELGRGLKF